MTETSARFAMPLLQPGQAQKELYHNEALALLDLALHPAVVAIGVDAPPSTPAVGQCWIVGSSPTGAWSGRAGEIAGWTSGGWRFVAPIEGMLVWSGADSVWARRSATTWEVGVLPASRISVGGVQVLGPREPAIATPSGGTTIDAEARATIAAILAALRSHGLIAS